MKNSEMDNYLINETLTDAEQQMGEPASCDGHKSREFGQRSWGPEVP